MKREKDQAIRINGLDNLPYFTMQVAMENERYMHALLTPAHGVFAARNTQQKVRATEEFYAGSGTEMVRLGLKCIYNSAEAWWLPLILQSKELL